MTRPTFKDSGCGYGPDMPLFVNGAARGLRSFRLGLDGWLRGVTYEQVWRPGENIAKCMVVAAVPHAKPSVIADSANPDYAKEYSRVVAGWGYPRDPGQEPRLLPGYRSAACPGLDPACACGFYAYHDGSRHGYIGGGYASGIIDGYGRVVLGPQGFRAARARLVAVALPHLDPQVARVYEDLLTARDGAQAALSDLPTGRWWTRRNVEETRARLRKAIAAVEQEIAELESAKAAGRHREAHARLRTNYPGLRLFDNDAEMLATYPVESLAYLVRGEEQGK